MLRLNIPITKVDAAQRLVYGVATAEIADRAGEICDYASNQTTLREMVRCHILVIGRQVARQSARDAWARSPPARSRR